MSDRVRTHTRAKPGGGTTTVRTHNRTGRRALISPRHSWKLLGRALRATRRKKHGLAVVLLALGLGELTAWLTVEGTSLILATAGMLALGVATLGAMVTGARR